MNMTSDIQVQAAAIINSRNKHATMPYDTWDENQWIKTVTIIVVFLYYKILI